MVLEEGFSLLAEANEIADLVAMEVGESPVSNRVGRGGAPQDRETREEGRKKKKEDREDRRWEKDEEERKPWKARVVERDVWLRYAWSQTEMDKLSSMRKAEARLKSRRSGKRPDLEGPWEEAAARFGVVTMGKNKLGYLARRRRERLMRYEN